MTSLTARAIAATASAVCALLWGMLLAVPASAEPAVSILPLPFEVREFRGPASRVAAVAPSLAPLRSDGPARTSPVVVVWGAGGSAALRLVDTEIRPVELGPISGDLEAAERGRGAIAQSRIETEGPITASLTEPTGEQRHEALGGGAHARSVSIAERRPVQPGGGVRTVPTDVTKVDAGPGAVFEDREPRLARLSRSGGPEIVTVKSYADRGSALAVLGRRDGAWRVVAETPPAGGAGRWLNPAAVADFLGTGSPQIALVRAPHAEGLLQLWTFEGDRLTLEAEKAGYANHAFGRAAQDLAAAADTDGDGRPELVLPTVDRLAIAIVAMRGGIREVARISLPARAETGVAVLGAGRDLHILVGLEDGRVADIRP